MGACDCLHVKWTWMCVYKPIYAHAYVVRRYVASQVLSGFFETRVSHWPKTHLIQLACSVSKLKGSSQISPRLQGPGTTPSFFFFFSHGYWRVNSDSHACTGSTLLPLCLCLVGQGFQQFRRVLNSLYSQGRIRTPDPLTLNCQKMLGLQARTNHHVGLAPKCFEYCCGIILLYTLKMSCSHC